MTQRYGALCEIESQHSINLELILYVLRYFTGKYISPYHTMQAEINGFWENNNNNNQYHHCSCSFLFFSLIFHKCNNLIWNIRCNKCHYFAVLHLGALTSSLPYPHLNTPPPLFSPSSLSQIRSLLWLSSYDSNCG